MPPMHPWCRSTTIAVIDGAVTKDLKRRARDPETGELYEVPSDMTYEEWKKSINSGSSNIRMSQKSDIKWLPKRENITASQYKELRDYASERGIVLRGFKKSDVDIDLAKEFIDDTAKILEMYPSLKGATKQPFTLQLSKAMNSNDFAETNPGVTHIIKLNSDAMRSKTKLAEEYKKLSDDGWFVKGTDYHSIIYHEMGHIIGDKYEIDGLEIAKTILNTNNEEVAFGYLEKNISEYSVSQLDGSEIISEVFSAYNKGIKNNFVLTFIKICDIL